MRKRAIAAALCMAMCLSLASCGTGSTTTETSKQTSTKSTEEKKLNTNVSSGYYMSLGTLKEPVEQTGDERDDSNVTIQGYEEQKVVFPVGTIESMSIGSWSRKEKAYQPKTSEVERYLDELENAEVVKKIPTKVIENNPRIETHLVYLNKKGEYRTITITNFGDGYQWLSVEKDDETNFSKEVSIKAEETSQEDSKKYEQVALKSKEAEQMIKDWMKWEEKGKSAFDKIEKATWTDEQGTTVELTDEQLETLKGYFPAAQEITESPCGSENYFECTLKDGSKFHFSISGDGECISTDQQVYEMNDMISAKLVKFFKKIRKEDLYAQFTSEYKNVSENYSLDGFKRLGTDDEYYNTAFPENDFFKQKDDRLSNNALDSVRRTLYYQNKKENLVLTITHLYSKDEQKTQLLSVESNDREIKEMPQEAEYYMTYGHTIVSLKLTSTSKEKNKNFTKMEEKAFLEYVNVLKKAND